MKTYKILTLGASGAGKTVFLASMFKSLSIQGEHGFYLEVEDFTQQKRLTDIYTNLIIGNWPDPTKYKEISEWTFTCCVKNRNLENFPICQFSYFDYAGGRLTAIDENAHELQAIIRQADAILGLLDGQKIQALLTNSNEDNKIDNFLNTDLPALINWMSHSQAPIQFVISKWDLLENNFGLQEISDRLLEIPEFKKLVLERNRESSPVRLIPVSSVGFGFATPQPDGSMKKIAGSIPRPFHMEVPMSCVIPDLVEKEIQVKIQYLIALSNEKIREDSEFNKLQLLNNFLKGILKFDILIDMIVEFLVSNYLEEDKDNIQLEIIKKTIFNKIDNFVLAKIRKQVKANDKKITELNELRQKRDESIQKIQDKTTALKSAVTSFLYISNKLSQDFYDSEIIID
ncbi:MULTISPECIES: hypothetical protein [unclassified Moorena]|uniref:hypothetical protein n=1 Tax=unclassified Moorena TaxID=2683338 RepID=UPI0013C946CC|nr:MULTISPECIES: hypothetical protein [unclassified Moorena]NEO23961.1 hypothetical protein [Moorena sp. SIO4A5]NEO92427.1 hypothetical protein [Moorena sp. SIO3G5]NEP26128.1 hypothetical protein [Moorena sp. SIO3I6]